MMNTYSPLDAAIRGALPLPPFAARPPAAFGPIFHPPSQPVELAAVSGGAGAGIVAFTTGGGKILCGAF